MADYNSDITKKNFVCNGCGDDTASEDLCDECEAKETHHPTEKEVRDYMEHHNADEVGQGDNAWDMEEALYHLELSGKYYQPQDNCLHNYDSNICRTCGHVEIDENEVSKCPNCEKKAKSMDIDYLGDGVYQCPNCKN